MPQPLACFHQLILIEEKTRYARYLVQQNHLRNLHALSWYNPYPIDKLINNIHKSWISLHKEVIKLLEHLGPTETILLLIRRNRASDKEQIIETVRCQCTGSILFTIFSVFALVFLLSITSFLIFLGLCFDIPRFMSIGVLIYEVQNTLLGCFFRNID